MIVVLAVVSVKRLTVLMEAVSVEHIQSAINIQIVTHITVLPARGHFVHNTNVTVENVMKTPNVDINVVTTRGHIVPMMDTATV